MADSVDRVFSHALSTVSKLRTGSSKPPPSTRLRLYGLYKQAMEGDVSGIMSRPSPSDPTGGEKWDAWNSCAGLSRTEAKRQYITTLIETMRVYAAPSPDARELVEELEFVWDQVKSNVSSSASSSPPQTVGMSGTYPGLSAPQETPDAKGMRVLDPEAQVVEDETEVEGEEFVDAPDSQYELPSSPYVERNEEAGTLQPRPPTPMRRESGSSTGDRWRKRVEASIIKMTAEVAALREQLESRRYFSHQRRYSLVGWLLRGLLFAVKHIALDFVILGIMLLWMRRKKNKRLEGAIRVLLGDAVAQVQKKVGVGKNKS